jgi:hypothetical protein
MKAPFFVEVLHGNKEVRHRHRVDVLPIRLGRGYDNDIILDDPHISAHHAIVDREADAGLTVQDLDSQSGIIHKNTRRKELSIDGNTIFRLGHTSIRVRTCDFPVDNEIAGSAFYGFEGWPPAAVGITLIICLVLADSWLGDVEKFEAIRYPIAVVVALLIAMVWCGFWSFANRLFGGSARLGRHLFILGCGFAAMEAWSYASTSIAYALSWEVATRYGSNVVMAIFAVMVFYHLLHIKPSRGRLFAVLSGAMALFGSGLLLMVNYNNNGRLTDELFMHERFPPALRLSADKPVSQLIVSATALKTKVDEERGKSVSGDEADSDADD